MDIIQALDIYGTLAISVFVVMVGGRVTRYLYLVMTKSRSGGRTMNVVDRLEYKSWWGGLMTVFAFPRKFGTKSNRLFTFGAILYHIDIITLSVCYAVTAGRMITAMMSGDPILNVATGEMGANFSVANILAIVFGSGEHAQASFLYGEYASFYVNFTWFLISLAVIGNLMIIFSRIFQNGGGSVVSDIDPAVRGIRVGGIKNKSHLLVSLMITGIIWSEIFARLHLFEHAVYIHSFLGVTILMLVPFTYLIHTIFIPVYLFYAARRYRLRYVG